MLLFPFYPPDTYNPLWWRCIIRLSFTHHLFILYASFFSSPPAAQPFLSFRQRCPFRTPSFHHKQKEGSRTSLQSQS